MPAPPTVRAARAADEELLGALDWRSWSPLHSVGSRPRSPLPFFDAAHLPAHYLVAELDGLDGLGEPGGPAGFIRLVPPSELASHAHVRQIQGLAVDERARRRGVARGASGRRR